MKGGNALAPLLALLVAGGLGVVAEGRAELLESEEGRLGVEEPDENCTCTGWCSLDDEKPAPCLEPMDLVEVANPISNRSTKRTAYDAIC